MQGIATLRRVVAVSSIVLLSARAAAQAIDEIIVTADFRERPASELPANITVLDNKAIEGMAVQHFEELIGTIPNLNWSGDGHRARYLQIRGVGELEQYQGAPNPSVGFLIDDIDFSGIGTIGTVFDLQQIEVLRGSQGTRYGANALAGLIYMQSAQPTAEWTGRVHISTAADNAFAAGVALGGALTTNDELMFRFSAHHHQSDGFRDNTYLGRADTNGRDETTLRGRLRWLPGDDWQVDLAALFVDINDGYDAFSLNSGFTMLSDNPGRDAQESAGLSLRMEYAGLIGMKITSITALADSDIVFSYDADWGNADSWAPVTYDYVSSSDRRRKTASQELRLVAADWLVGAYAMRLDDKLFTVNQGVYYDPLFDFADSLDDTLGSDYAATSFAVFGQYEKTLGSATRMSAGLRMERRTTDYSDTAGLRAGPAESMLGGELMLSHDHSELLTSFASLSRGYKAGGFNLGQVPDDRREFAAEVLWNLEAGIRSVSRDGALAASALLFASRRLDQQVRTSAQLLSGDPASFVFFTDNAAKGVSFGFEADVRWVPGEAWSLYANLGFLNAKFDEFKTPQVDLSGREQAHAPDYTWAVGGSFRHPGGMFVRADITARDAFYFDVSHDQMSSAYQLVSARIGYETVNWTAQLWARNVFDERYAVRGFFFGNEPPDFPDRLYTRPGDPRQIGFTFDLMF